MDPGPTPVSFANQIQPIFDEKCVQCHGEGGFGGLDLRDGESHANLVDQVSNGYSPALLVSPGEPTESVLYGKVADTGQFGGVMPPSNGGLSAEQLGLIERWIEEGANP
jgi:mono/diheme cytochrome c family protein